MMMAGSSSFPCINLLLPLLLLLLQQTPVLAVLNCTSNFIPQGSKHHTGHLQFETTDPNANFGTANLQIGDPAIFNISNRAGSKFRFQTCYSTVVQDPYYFDDREGNANAGYYMIYTDFIRVIDQYNHCLTGRNYKDTCQFAPNCDKIMYFSKCTDTPDASYQTWRAVQIVNMTADYKGVVGYYHIYPWYFANNKRTILFEDWDKEENVGGGLLGTVVT